MGGGKDQGPATQVIHLRLNQPFSFCSDSELRLKELMEHRHDYLMRDGEYARAVVCPPVEGS